MTVLLESIADESLRRLYAYWQDKRAGGRLPTRHDIDPLELRFALGWMNLVEVHHDPLRFRFRLHGTMLAAYTGHEMTGLFLDDHPDPEHRVFLARTWAETVDRQEPMHHIHDRSLNGRQQHYESLRLPFSSDGRTVDFLLIAAQYCGIPTGGSADRSGLHAVAV